MKKAFIVFGFILVGAAVFLSFEIYRVREAKTEELRRQQSARAARLGKSSEPPAPVLNPQPPEPAASAEPMPAAVPENPPAKALPNPRTARAAAPQSIAPNSGGKQVKDQLARVALSFVGADPEAEQYWFGAINDPDSPAKERQDLIEDLNEDGLSDPKHPTPDDLPLILNRLRLIELVAWSAMDQVNADAFMEAYKDLVNLAQVAQGGGEPVK